MTPTLQQALAWAADGAAYLRGMMTRMGDDAFAKPSGLPGWTRAHVLTHVARNADAMVNLVTWARTGVPTPAYASRDERDADIETGAGRSAAEIRADLIASSDRLAAAVRETPEEAWSARIADTRGRRMIASDVLWLRARETWIHAIDLDAGASFADLPRPMLRELLTDAAATLGGRPEFPRLLLVPSDESRTWTVGEASAGSAEPLEVRGTAAELAAWLLGRSKGRELRTAEGKRPPALPPWL